MLELGYRNSDFLFYDRLLIVEGRTDAAILPALLQAAGLNQALIATTGYPTMEGVPGDLRSLQLAVHKQERIISAISAVQQRRLYLFDGDRTQTDRDQLIAMRDGTGESNIPIKFLPRTEIENYLLEPKAICRALQEEGLLADIKIETTAEAVQVKIESILGGKDDKKLFPRGVGKDPLKTVKGSILLQRLYASFENLSYDKERSGSLIARYIQAEDAPFVTELRDALADFFESSKVARAGK